MKDTRVIFVTGPSGVGKSSLAMLLAKKIHYRQLSLDAIRQQYRGDTKKAWLTIWNAIRTGDKVIVDSTGASRIFRLVYRAAVFEHSNPVIVSLSTKKRLPPRRRPDKMFGPIRLSHGKRVTPRYLEDAGESIHADINIDATRLTNKQVLNKVLSFLGQGGKDA